MSADPSAYSGDCSSQVDLSDLCRPKPAGWSLLEAAEHLCPLEFGAYHIEIWIGGVPVRGTFPAEEDHMSRRLIAALSRRPDLMITGKLVDEGALSKRRPLPDELMQQTFAAADPDQSAPGLSPRVALHIDSNSATISYFQAPSFEASVGIRTDLPIELPAPTNLFEVRIERRKVTPLPTDKDEPLGLSNHSVVPRQKRYFTDEACRDWLIDWCLNEQKKKFPSGTAALKDARKEFPGITRPLFQQIWKKVVPVDWLDQGRTPAGSSLLVDPRIKVPPQN